MSEHPTIRGNTLSIDIGDSRSWPAVRQICRAYSAGQPRLFKRLLARVDAMEAAEKAEAAKKKSEAAKKGRK